MTKKDKATKHDQKSLFIFNLTWLMSETHREQLEKWILENLPLLILVSNHRNIDFTEILGEQENQTDRAMGKH